MSAIFLCVNAMIAAGMLSLPFVFYHGGIVAGATTFLVLAIPSIASTEWTLEAMARAEVRFLGTIVCETNRINRRFTLGEKREVIIGHKTVRFRRTENSKSVICVEFLSIDRSEFSMMYSSLWHSFSHSVPTVI